MPLVQNRSAATDQTKKPQTSGFQTASVETSEKAAPAAALASDGEARHAQGRWAVSWAGVPSALKSNAFWIIGYTIFFLSALVWQIARGKPLTPTFIVGETLDKLVTCLVFRHMIGFKGKTTQTWVVSWLFRLTMFFASFCISDVARHEKVSAFAAIFVAFVWAGVSIAWQYVKQAKSARQSKKSKDTGDVSPTP